MDEGVGAHAVVGDKFKRSSFCADSSCVEVAQVNELVFVRASYLSDNGSLAFTRKEWRAFIDGAKAGEFDLNDET